ncbi:MAG: elongation factor P maturation arginine rhamnosyltransferase EarP [Parashewanella sp.]
MNKQNQHWDIFCEVIDNYGDIGVTWRLAKQLAKEYQLHIKLWVDDLSSFGCILPELNPELTSQHHSDVEILLWSDENIKDWSAGKVIIEAFACELPTKIADEICTLAMSAPFWINLEYLSAEKWVDDLHGLPSFQLNGAKKYFYFPGFTDKTGGLIYENDLIDLQTHWIDKQSKQAFFDKFNINIKTKSTIILSIFSYETPALEALSNEWINGDIEIHALVPTGRALNSILPSMQLSADEITLGRTYSKGNLQLHVLPMTDQQGYDELLWSCDINIVRGEDSFLRAQWAKKPFIWHIYPQDEQAHIEKLNVFLDRYCETLPNDLSKIQRKINLSFNSNYLHSKDQASIIQQWMDFVSQYQKLKTHAENWPNRALSGSDLATRLVDFVKNR